MRSKPFVAGVLAIGLVVTGIPYVAAQDDPRTKPVFKANHSLTDVLTAAQTQGKALILALKGGMKYTGKVKAVGAHAVVLTGLRGREFFDAFIPLDSIVAMEERVRMR